jgi:hypothetical protein
MPRSNFKPTRGIQTDVSRRAIKLTLGTSDTSSATCERTSESYNSGGKENTQYYLFLRTLHNYLYKSDKTHLEATCVISATYVSSLSRNLEDKCSWRNFLDFTASYILLHI